MKVDSLILKVYGNFMVIYEGVDYVILQWVLDFISDMVVDFVVVMILKLDLQFMFVVGGGWVKEV